MREFPGFPKAYQLLSVDEFLSLTEQEKAGFARIKLVPPNLDDEHFGHFKAHYKRPSHRYSEAFLQDYAKIRETERSRELKSLKRKLASACIITLSFAILVGYLLTIGEDTFALELIEAACLIFSGGTADFVLAKTSANRESPPFGNGE